MTQKYKAEDIVRALSALHPDPPWAFIAELRVGTGYGRGREWDDENGGWQRKPNEAEQRLDAWAINCWPSKGYQAVTYEVKVSRADFLHELQDPTKREIGLRYSNLFYFAAPKGLIRVRELPSECGLVEVDGDGIAAVARSAPLREMDDPPVRFLASVARRAGRSEKTPGQIKQMEKDLVEVQADKRRHQEQTWSLETEALEFERLSGELLLLDGWQADERGFYHAGEAGRFSAYEGLRRELERLGKPLETLRGRVTLPSPYDLDERYGRYLYDGVTFAKPLGWIRQRLYREGITDLPELVGELVREMIIWGNGRGLFKKEVSWMVAVTADEMLRTNGWRLSRTEAVVQAFQSLLNPQYATSPRLPEEIIGAFRAAIIPGGSNKPLERRLPALHKALKDWPN